MYDKFKYERVALSLIRLDDRNPRIVTQERLSSEEAIAAYFFEHEELSGFVKTIATEGRNPGAERPYVVKDGKGFVVIEGNTRIATYKLLTGQLVAPEAYKTAIPLVAPAMRDELLSVEVTIAPSRDALMTIMARAHFGRGDKNRWGYLGSRKAVFDDREAGRSISQLSHVFGRSPSQIRELLLEYMLYQEALKLSWTDAEREMLLRPSLEFNPPVRFLQSTGHKQLVGIELDRVNLEIKFLASDARSKFKHLVKRTVIDDNGPSATASYSEVFAGYVEPATEKKRGEPGGDGGNGGQTGEEATAEPKDSSPGATNPEQPAGGGEAPKPHALFNYPVTRNDLTLRQLMKEARGLNTRAYPAAGSALLRSLIEVLLKVIIEGKGLNEKGKLLDLEGSLNLLIGSGKSSGDDSRILKEFKSSHLSYMNLSAHATVVPNQSRLMMARDCIDAFVKRNV